MSRRASQSGGLSPDLQSLFYFKPMYLCYIDESGTPEVPGTTSHYVLAALTVPIYKWKVCEDEISRVKLKYDLQEAIDKFGHPEIFNTDQGSQFTSPLFTEIWEANKMPEVKISMDGRGRATDNAFIERLWRSVKQENIYSNHYPDGASLWVGLHDYFTYYNSERQHQSLNYQTPESIYHSAPVQKQASLAEEEKQLPLNHVHQNSTDLCLFPVQHLGYTTLIYWTIY